MSKDTKILIPEIPGEWTERTRSGHKCIWNDGLRGKLHSNGLPRIELTAPEKGLYAERIDGAWYWVSGCNKCTGKSEGWIYTVCDKQDVCVSCHAHRTTLTEIPWGHRDGFICNPCQDREAAAAKAEALAKFAESEFDDSDFEYQDQCKCPHCATVIHIESEDHRDQKMDCDTCGGEFQLTLSYEVSYTTTVIGERITA